MNKKISRNKIRTPSYFVKRLKDNGFIVWKMFQQYNKADSRLWTIMVDPCNSSTYITCYHNKDFNGDIMFEINDGGNRFVRNFSLRTDSLESVILLLLENDVPNNAKNSRFFKKLVNTSSEIAPKEKQQKTESVAHVP
jgi:hypothetical protein